MCTCVCVCMCACMQHGLLGAFAALYFANVVCRQRRALKCRRSYVGDGGGILAATQPHNCMCVRVCARLRVSQAAGLQPQPATQFSPWPAVVVTTVVVTVVIVVVAAAVTRFRIGNLMMWL